MLTKLDEFGGLVDTVRSDTSLCVVKNVHEIQTKCEEIKQIFRRIDQLEKFVQIVRDNVSTMEECVNKAENEMGSFSSFKKLFSSLVGSKKPSSETRPEFKPPDIFVTEHYLKPVSGVEVPVSGVEVPVSSVEVPASGVEVSVSGIEVPMSGVGVSGIEVPVSNVELTQDKDTSKEGTVQSPSSVESGKT